MYVCIYLSIYVAIRRPRVHHARACSARGNDLYRISTSVSFISLTDRIGHGFIIYSACAQLCAGQQADKLKAEKEAGKEVGGVCGEAST